MKNRPLEDVSPIENEWGGGYSIAMLLYQRVVEITEWS